MLQSVIKAIGFELAFDTVARTTCTHSLRVSTLNHEAWDDPVKDQPVIEALLGKANKVIHRIWRYLRIELKLNHFAAVHLDRCNRMGYLTRACGRFCRSWLWCWRWSRSWLRAAACKNHHECSKKADQDGVSSGTLLIHRVHRFYSLVHDM
ncbi:hypothetical protein D1872_234250 [compost metagenome]